MRRTRPTVLRTCGAGLLCVALVLLGASCLWAQAGAGNSEERLPRSIREAYERAEGFTEEPGAKKGEAETEEARLWTDGIHYLGIGGGLVLLAALGVGLWIFLVIAFRRGPDRVLLRRAWRRRHYALGLAAGALALAHVIGRSVQLGELEAELGAAQLATAALLLLVISGIIRAWPPRPLARHPRWWMWSHRVLTVVALLALFWHGIATYAEFVLHR